ncbi:MAG: MBOAT family protein [Defluviitaleaceae bacterium]|nr:MBOAT family protein [Defluviitaleaceae bacterium]MCL2262308.1 MBOAT family protein [Defluviitaleaceae bacterium]
MIFSSITFLYYFLPVALILYFITPMPGGSVRLRNIVLLVLSLVFYAWGEPIFVLVMIAQCVSSWALALLIDKYRGQTLSRVFFIISISIDLGVLAIFKYLDFFIINANNLFGAEFSLVRLILPIGISFYTFQILSYTIDLYRGRIQVNRNLLDFATFVAMFPQLVAGPIIRYADVELSITKREHRFEDVSIGLRRFVIGLAKKVLIANVMGEILDIYVATNENTVLFSWLYVTAFALKIYFDFSGYSDMAIGLGRVFGFRFLENFNYPYIAKSIAEFWQRWHISLGAWFKDYVYIPLGGNRVKAPRFVLNTLIIWFLIGFWHGASWNFIVWGLYFAAVILLEKFVLSRFKLPRFFGHSYVLFSVLFTAVLFNATDFSDIGATFSRLFGFGADSFVGTESLYYLRSYLVPLAIGIIGSTPLLKNFADKLSDRKIFKVLEPLTVGVLLIVSTAFIVDGSFNPFIYFRF